ncbi:MAG: acyl carrier protein [Candidatus Bathyarchaeota archaeon]|nr:acyl carrier protein [Candidatus Termiticorpusculum sp.]
MFKRVEEIIRKTFDKAEVSITEETNLIDDLGLNSLELAELVYVFEDEFNIEIPDRDIVNFRTVKDIVSYLKTLTK